MDKPKLRIRVLPNLSEEIEKYRWYNGMEKFIGDTFEVENFHQVGNYPFKSFIRKDGYFIPEHCAETIPEKVEEYI